MIGKFQASLFLSLASSVVFLLTPLPFSGVAHFLKSESFQMKGISGSLVSGVRADEITVKNRMGELRINQLHFAAYAPWNFLFQRKLEITDLSLGRVDVRVKPSETEEKVAAPIHSRILAVGALFQMEIHRLRVDSFFLEVPGRPPFLLGTVNADNLKAAQLMLEGANVAFLGPGFEFKTGPVQVNHQGFRLVTQGTGTIRPDQFKFLNKPASFTLRAELIDSEFAFELDTFNSKFKAHWDPRISFVEVHDLTLSEHLDSPLPFRNLSLTMQADDPRKLGTAEANTHYRLTLGNQEFESVGGTAASTGFPASTSKSRTATYTFHPATLAGLATGVSGQITSSAHQDVAEILSELFFQKRYIFVDSDNRRWIDLQKPFFSGEISFGSRGLASVTTAPKPMRSQIEDKQLEALKSLSTGQLNKLQQMREATHDEKHRRSPASGSQPNTKNPVNKNLPPGSYDPRTGAYKGIYN